MNRTCKLVVGLLMTVPWVVAGCNRTLFSDADPYHQSRIDKYWDGDSAQRATAERQRAAQTGFGFPAGLANQ